MTSISHLTFFLSCVILELRDFHGRFGCCVLNMAEHKAKEARVNNWVKQFSTDRSSPIFGGVFCCFFKPELSFYSVELLQILAYWLNAYSLASCLLSWMKPMNIINGRKPFKNLTYRFVSEIFHAEENFCQYPEWSDGFNKNQKSQGKTQKSFLQSKLL